MSDDLVSIIIPTYNMAHFVTDAVDSAIAQTYRYVEIIIVDDGSTDNTEDVIKTNYKEYLQDTENRKAPFITYYKKTNGKTASALNYGIIRALGEWIHWLSADDMLLPDAVDVMLKHIKQYPEHIYKDAIFFSNWYMMDEFGNKIYNFIEPERNYNSKHDVCQELIQHFFGNGSTSMIHQNVFTKCGLFDETLPATEDYEFWLRATMLHDVKLLAVPEFTLRYRAHSSNLSRQWKDKAWQLENQYKRRIVHQYNQNNPDKQIQWKEHVG